jgi:hypothetical protein
VAGVPLDTVVDAVLEPVAARLAVAVERGRLTPDEADSILTRLGARLTDRFSAPR